MATSQDHKRRDEGDLGPNTGGMGAYSPAPVVTPAVDQRILDEVIRPTLDGMAAEGAPFTGFLYAGLMIDRDGAPKVIEFNVRFGDPETQPIMMRLESDLAELVLAALDGDLAGRDRALGSAAGDRRRHRGARLSRQGAHRRSDLEGLDAAFGDDVKVFHAGTRDDNGNVVSAGGRVLTVCALGDDLGVARDRAYAAARRIRLDGSFYRRDIGHRALRSGARLTLAPLSRERRGYPQSVEARQRAGGAAP